MKCRKAAFKWRKIELSKSSKQDFSLQDLGRPMLDNGSKRSLLEAAKTLNSNGTLSKILPSNVSSSVPLSSADEFALFVESLPVSASSLRLRAHLYRPRAAPGGNRSICHCFLLQITENGLCRQNLTACFSISMMTAMTQTR